MRIRYLLLLAFILFSPPSISWAETGDDAYDPFADYAEFDSAGDEEADIHFFRNGRFFSLGLLGAYRGFTGNLSALYGTAPAFGLMINYFFDMRSALQIDFITSDHKYTIYTNDIVGDGNVTMTGIGAYWKYFFLQQNVTKGLGAINPYILVGAQQLYRTVTLTGYDTAGRDSALSLTGGAGIEFPILRNRSFIGLQGNYHYVSFKDENRDIELVDASGNVVTTKQKPSGDTYTFFVILGFNY